MNKRFNKIDKYGDMLANLRRRGISYSLNFIFGWDGETRRRLCRHARLSPQHKVPAAYFNILTPVKGTPALRPHERRGPDHQPLGHRPLAGPKLLHPPPYGTPGALERNVQNMYRQFYSLRSMFARLPMPVTQSNIASWVINFSQRRLARADAAHNDFDGY